MTDVYFLLQGGPGELSLRAGDVVTMVEQVDSEWFRGTCRGSTGFFPRNYVKPLVSYFFHTLVKTKSVTLVKCVQNE